MFIHFDFERHTHLSIKGLTAKIAYQSKNQAMRSKEQPAVVSDRIVLRHRSEDDYKNILLH